jgi:hypothetical protein
VSKFNAYHNIRGVSDPLNERNSQIIEALKLAIFEDSIAYWQKLNSGEHYKHTDLTIKGFEDE